jgi:penicillin-binding protein-related factor A (putative recombinase)
MTEQQEMFKRANHANLGKGFEAELSAVHDWYRMQGIVDIVKNASDWDFARKDDWFKYKSLFEQQRPQAALTGDGRYLMRVNSDVDYSGGGFVFDAKSTVEDRWSFSKIEPHQVNRLKQTVRCGSTAGIFIKFEKMQRVFWLPAPTLIPMFEKYQAASYGRRRAKPGTGSLAIADLEQHGIEIRRHPMNGLWDWWKELKP